MTCEQFDALWERAGGRCQICGQLFQYSPTGGPCIDHDYRHGYWAVRGLLCSTCNQNLSYRDRGQDEYGVSGPEIDHYLANPWYATLPYASAIDPKRADSFPPVDESTAMDLLRKVADEVEDARRRRLSAYPGLVQGLLSTVRWAHQALSEDSMAQIGSLPRPMVFVAIRESDLEPSNPPPEPDPGDCLACCHTERAHRRARTACIGNDVYKTPYGMAEVPCLCPRFRKAPG